jgi:hypothetical protein
MKHILFAGAALIAVPASAQEWNDPNWTDGSVPTPSWVASPAVGDGVDRVAEVSTSTQGGDPPALAYEPSVIDENGTYTRTAWIGSPNLPGDRFDNGEAKFRTNCNVSHFAKVDPIVYPGQASAGHHHTFIGNNGTDEDSDYDSLRTTPGSTCSGGPLNATAYWEPSLMFEIETGVYVPVKANIITFYYRTSYADAPTLYRLPRGFGFIGGANPADRLNVAGLAEIPDGAGWMKTRRYNGWGGWACFNGATVVPLAVGNTADPSDANYARQLVNADGTDPWGGACESASYTLIANLAAPGCWDGHNLTSPASSIGSAGRGHVRYGIYKTADQQPDHYKCPDGWWKVPTLEAKPEFPNGHGAVSGHAWRSKLHLSSDEMNPSTGLMDANPANWQPRGSTFHFDWMNGWDFEVMKTWLIHCVGVAINGTAGDPLTCNDSTISSTQKLLVLSNPPDPTLANTPVITIHTYYNDPAKDAFGPVPTGTVVDATVEHTH